MTEKLFYYNEQDPILSNIGVDDWYKIKTERRELKKRLDAEKEKERIKALSPTEKPSEKD